MGVKHNRTSSFLDRAFLWPLAAIELVEYGNRKPGFRIYVHGTGETSVQYIDGKRQEERYELTLPRPMVMALFELTIQHDLLATEIKRDLQRPQLSPAPRILLWNHQRSLKLLSKSDDAPSEPFDEVYKALLYVANRTDKMTPTYTGKYDHGYKPSVRSSWLRRFWLKGVYQLHEVSLHRLGDSLANFFFILLQMWQSLLFLILLFVVAYFFVEIDPEQAYGFGGGVWHGTFFYQNGILSLLTGRLYRAAHRLEGYRAGYIVGLIVVPFVVQIVVQVVRELYKRR